jgi:DNA repair exonuclease SbcCD ATPase subunit|tara:strand:+ start:104 stop:466 length:363 start_codon:yes stop_codon:yes gene_type:complete
MPYKDKEKQREVQRLWAQKQSPETKKKNYLRNQDNKKLMVEKLNQLKLDKGCCMLCGDYHPPCCFDFHHIEPKKNKQHEVSQLAQKGYKWETIQKEVDKCYMLCAPCHRKIHAGLLEIIG